MNNLMVGINKLIRNKNTITIIGIVLILGLLYYGYRTTVDKTISPIRVPVANKTIGSRQQISQDDIRYDEVAAITVNDNVVRANNVSSELIGKYTNINVTIPEGSMFFKSWLVDKNDIPGNWVEEINTEDGYEAYYFSTDAIKTLGNNVIPGSTIDIYMSALDENNQLMYGRLLENIEVLIVHDGSGNDVFKDASNPGSPSKLGFEVSHDFYILLYKAEHLSGVTLEIAPQGTVADEIKGKGVYVSSETLRDYIDTHTAVLDDETSLSDDKAQADES